MSITKSGSERSLQNACPFKQRGSIMKAANVLWIVMFSAVLAFPTSALSQVRQVQPRPGQQSPPDQTDPNAPPQIREVAPRGSAPQALMSRSADQQAPRYQLRQQIPRRWRLGIHDSVSPLGARVRSVHQNTPASDQLGLEPGDYILDVQGYPVGYYQGIYYDLGDLLNMNADPQGWVNINIWNFRTGRDAPYWVRLQRR
jgi:hypothetical protein